MKYIFAFLLLSLLHQFCVAQAEANNWHFGIKAEISFNSGSPQPVFDSEIPFPDESPVLWLGVVAGTRYLERSIFKAWLLTTPILGKKVSTLSVLPVADSCLPLGLAMVIPAWVSYSVADKFFWLTHKAAKKKHRRRKSCVMRRFPSPTSLLCHWLSVVAGTRWLESCIFKIPLLIILKSRKKAFTLSVLPVTDGHLSEIIWNLLLKRRRLEQ